MEGWVRNVQGGCCRSGGLEEGCQQLFQPSRLLLSLVRQMGQLTGKIKGPLGPGAQVRAPA